MNIKRQLLVSLAAMLLAQMPVYSQTPVIAPEQRVACIQAYDDGAMDAWWIGKLLSNEHVEESLKATRLSDILNSASGLLVKGSEAESRLCGEPRLSAIQLLSARLKVRRKLLEDQNSRNLIGACEEEIDQALGLRER